MGSQETSKELHSWPTSKGDPIGPVWSYGGKKGMYQAEALRAFAHDLVDRIKEFELPVRQAMRAASGDGLDVYAYCRMLQKRIDYMERDRKESTGEIQALQIQLARLRAAHEPRTEPDEAYIAALEAPQLREIIKLHRLRFAELRETIAQLSASPPPRGEPVAWVPVHPTNGPLWVNTIKSKDSDHPASYPLMPLYSAQPPAIESPDFERWRDEKAAEAANEIGASGHEPSAEQRDAADGAITELLTSYDAIHKQHPTRQDISRFDTARAAVHVSMCPSPPPPVEQLTNALDAADVLCNYARSYAGDTGLYREAPLWDAIETYQNQRATATKGEPVE